MTGVLNLALVQLRTPAEQGAALAHARPLILEAARNGAQFVLLPECANFVEARKDVAVVLHPLTDDRRILPLERTGEVLEAPTGFMLVVSYNPGYQNLLKALKPSTRQRFVAIEFDFLPKAAEIAVVATESGLDEARVAPLIALAHRLRALKGHDLEEGVSTRLLVYCACLIDSGMTMREAVRAAMIEPLTDEPDVRTALLEIADAMIR